ncbi:MAG: phosphotransferase [Dehalococcoidales bacterium]|nr:phosphotransferase [Dehalococcoidales bacterium]
MAELPELIQALLNPKAYPDQTPKVELVQTQISYILLAGEYVYKIKKPVDMGFLDYSTLEKRLNLCRKEVELNRRLCPDTYLGVVPIGKGFVLGGKGEAIEYAVKMRRLPQDKMMDILIKQNKVTPAMVEKVAEILVEFHQKATTSEEIARVGGIDAVIKNTSENFEQTEKYFGAIIEPETYQRLKDYTEGFIETNRALFLKRMAEGRVRDCHGDLHTAHVCFTNGICIYDCIEFIDRLRYIDVAADIAFLAMDLDHYSRKDLSDIFIDAYVKRSGDEELLKLLNFYKCYRAYVRGKIGCLHYDDPYVPATEKAEIAANAASYFKLAATYI